MYICIYIYIYIYMNSDMQFYVNTLACTPCRSEDCIVVKDDAHFVTQECFLEYSGSACVCPAYMKICTCVDCLCMYVCMYVCMWYEPMCLCTHEYTQACTGVYICTCIFVRLFGKYMELYILCVYVCERICIHTCGYAYICQYETNGYG